MLRRSEEFLAAPKMLSFFTAEKDTIFDASRKIFGPPYFETVLAKYHGKISMSSNKIADFLD